jgi:proto-oncogene tyrosine-protein kinase Met
MKEFNHSNVLKMRGICFGEDDLPMILLPYMENGDLLSYLRDGDNSLTIRDLLQFAFGIARGRVQ